MSSRHAPQNPWSVRWLAALAFVGVLSGGVAPVSAAEPPSLDSIIERASAEQPAIEDARGWSLAIDNDLFAPAQSDRDYTGGLGVTVSGAQTAEYWWSLDPLLRRLDSLVFTRDAEWSESRLHQGVQVGLMSFTPQDLAADEVRFEDRPYASLLFVSAARQYLAPDARSVRYSDLTFGILGLSLTSNLHAAIHKAVGSDAPRGYGHQIASGGEPTARYAIGGSTLRGRRLMLGPGLLETQTTWELSAGYLTEASYAVSARLGAINSPWWTFNPERVDYIVQPAPIARTDGRGLSEVYVWAGAKVRLRAYNAFLQGQFRDSDHVFASDEINHVIGEIWFGVTGQFAGGTQMSYAVRVQTSEVRDGLGRRDPVWAGVTISRGF
ncbi:MAG TPA: lipid A deacylase LpxR family protein [Steroidobacteraceae bacterium]